MPVVGRAEVLVSPSFKGAQQSIQKGLTGSAGSGMAKAASSGIGSKITSGIGKALKVGMATTGLTAGGVLGGAIFKGFGRLNSIEQARAKLLGLGNSAKTVDGIMKNALASVKGTAFGLDEAATTAGAVVAAGVKPGKELEGVLKTVADTATIAGTSMSDMGTIFGSVAARGKLQGDDMLQLTSKGVPVLQFLAKEYGVTAKQASDMVSKGQVDFKHFAEAMKNNIGGAALKSGETTQGAWKNMWASISRVGANMLSGIFPKLQGAFTGITKWLAPVEAKAKTVGAALGTFISKVATGAKGLYDLLVKGDFSSALRKAFGWEEDSGAVDMLFNLRDNLIRLGKTLRDVVVPAAKSLASMFKDQILPVLKQVGVFVVTKVVPAVASLVSWLSKNRDIVVPLVAALAAGVAVYKTVIAATRAWAVVQGLLNVAMSLNPIGLIIAGIAALVVGLIVAYKKSETFRNIVNAVFAAVKKVALAVVNWFVNTAWPFMKKVFQGIADAAKFMWTKVLKPTWAALSAAFQAVGKVVQAVWKGFFKPVFELIGAIIKWLWDKVAKPYFQFIAKAFQVLGDGIKFVWTHLVKPYFEAWGTVFKWLWNSVVKPVAGWIGDKFQALGRGIKKAYDLFIKPAIESSGKVVGTLKDKFQTAIDGIRTVWNKLEGIAKKPIKFVIQTVLNNGLIAAFNKLAGIFGTSKMATIPLPAGFAQGGWTGPGSRLTPAGIVHADEYVINKRARGMFERRFPGYLRHINATGTLPGYAGGGLVSPTADASGKNWPLVGGSGSFTPLFASRLRLAESILGMVFNIFQRGFRPSTSYSGTSHAGDAVDLGPAQANIVAVLRSLGIAAWRRGPAQGFIPHIHAVPGPSAGRAGGSGIWQWQDYLNGGDGLGGRDYEARSGSTGLLSLLGKGFKSIGAWLKSKFTGPLNKLQDLAGGPFGQLAAGMARKTAGQLVDYGKKLMPFDSGGLLMPGYTLAYNGTGKPEPVFTDDQWKKMQGGGRVLNIGQVGYDPQQIFTTWDRMDRRAMHRHNVVPG